MQKYLKQSMQFLKSEDGASSVEYALLVSLIALVAMGAVAALGINVLKLFDSFILP
jgi:Flp pilus assembly pilin Flp